ncbi:hypothetical protein [Mesobacillus foraminis]|uniref:Uncharacterized protein n=1 Tax=Mesobacillus foraminis TaxID=279826 RepID=A0A4R2BNV7_9BACI|nr:hypothetical protein [Mesobacillus foraminis]TCN27829.1 hypothetical protein EV146_101157 [Mesobacillus foraminis]
MSQQEKKLNEGTSFTFNGKEMTQEELNALLNKVGDKVNGLFGEASSVLDKASIKVNKAPVLSGDEIRSHVQQLIPKIETSNENGMFKMMLNGQSILEFNLSNLLKKH